MEQFRYVYVPADLARPMEQWTHEREKKSYSTLYRRMKEHFYEVQTAFRQGQNQSRRKGCEEDLGAAIDAQAVDRVYLCPPSNSNGYVSMTLYVDGIGAILGLPFNTRATRIIQACGIPTMPIFGDAFTVSLYDDGLSSACRDLFLSEISYDAPWMCEARNVHPQNAKEIAALEAFEDLIYSAKSDLTNVTLAQEARQRGNEAYQKEHYEEALSAYTECLECYPAVAVACSNRSMTHLQLEDFSSALDDAEVALNLDASLVKARYRKAVALEHLGREHEAIKELSQLLELQPNNVAATEKLKELQSRRSVQERKPLSHGRA